MITIKNYSYRYYHSKDFKAFISFGMGPKSTELEYYVTVLKDEEVECFQKTFFNCEDACSYINSKYGKLWELGSLEKAKASASSCSTCVAH